ncbi:gluconate 2-dehydrogenase subunit 3 family protein [Parapedobacter sp. ISTM3]|uniref:gluconate 2-dehydrogenase subunit 3 family protein n=1 Tax=Parapedobacter sp. ISTM3 TaxID=2800130 RepID=UPI001907BE35|nr:gluconate 2-dehydrogenase subunit 3 family protein [Parapedobacter sp. ISTM3]MBK1439213.1 gluconate 2-dehydrogenase subunit 3 family protein [Parapedobacter sp. ISTM3]
MTRRRALYLIMVLVGVITAYPLLKWVIYTSRKPDLGKLNAMRPLISELVETIIPATDSPGAKEAGVADFVIGKVIFYLDRREQNFFIDGLGDIEQLSRKGYGQSFMNCTMDQRVKILECLEDQQLFLHPLLMKVKRKLFGFSFISYLKAYTVEGYCTSLLGATRCLNYQATPQSYQPCVPLVLLGQRSWATK